MSLSSLSSDGPPIAGSSVGVVVGVGVGSISNFSNSVGDGVIVGVTVGLVLAIFGFG